MVDMDQTLIEAVLDDDKRYSKAWGDLISYKDRHGNLVKLRVHIRPNAISMVKEIVENGHHYIVWSAGEYYYVHAVMENFCKKSGVWPEIIYTRNDMVPDGMKNGKYKSMKAMGYDDFVIVDDNPDLVISSERDRIIKIKAWTMEQHSDNDLDWVSNLMKLYGNTVPVIVKPKKIRFVLTDL